MNNAEKLAVVAKAVGWYFQVEADERYVDGDLRVMVIDGTLTAEGLTALLRWAFAEFPCASEHSWTSVNADHICLNAPHKLVQIVWPEGRYLDETVVLDAVHEAITKGSENPEKGGREV